MLFGSPWSVFAWKRGEGKKGTVALLKGSVRQDRRFVLLTDAENFCSSPLAHHKWVGITAQMAPKVN